MDIDAARLRVVGGFAGRMIEAAGSPFRLVLTTDRAEALEGASYVINQIRVGKMQARRGDEYLGLRHGLIGQETTGVGGMANALRTIPVALDIANDLLRIAPEALLLNFANPSGLVTEALFRYAPGLNVVGVCNVGITTKMGLLDLWEKSTGQKVAPERAQLETLGMNHLTWHRGFKIDGKDVWPELFEAILKEARRQLRDGKEPEWDPCTLETLGMLPNYYLHYYYYTSKVLAEQQKWPPSRAETVMEIENQLLQKYADPQVVQMPPELMKRGGAYYSELATQVIDDHWNDRGGVHVINTRNGTVTEKGIATGNSVAVAGWPEDWVLELPARVDASGIHPLPAQALTGAPAGLVAQVKAYELLTVQAAVQGDRRALNEALLAHPLGPEADKVEAVANDMLEVNRQFLGRFF
jgi:6-phospho-beta-glucosidase